MDNSIRKGILAILSVNVISMLFSVITNFALPGLLSIETYAIIQTYNLYVGFSGLFTLGFSDGIYLKYGGGVITQIPKNELCKDLSTFRLFQLSFVLVGVIVYLVSEDVVLLFSALSIFPLNMTSFFSLLYQATGEFGAYSKITGVKATIVFVANFLLIGVLLLWGIEKAVYFLWLYLIINVGYWLYLERGFIKLGYPLYVKDFSFKTLIENAKSGLPLTLGTFSSILFTSIDRWFIKALLDVSSFAYYSFAVSIDNFLGVAISPFTITLYNDLCKNKEKSHVSNIRRLIIFGASLLAASAFVVEFIILQFIPKYTESISVLYFLFLSKVFYVIILAIYVNLYKAYKRQSDYLKGLIISIVFNAIVSYCLYLILGNMLAFAIGTLLSNIIWLVICCLDFKQYAPDLKEFCYMLSVMAALLGCAFLHLPIIALALYTTFIIISAHLLLRINPKSLLSYIKNK